MKSVDKAESSEKRAETVDKADSGNSSQTDVEAKIDGFQHDEYDPFDAVW